MRTAFFTILGIFFLIGCQPDQKSTDTEVPPKKEKKHLWDWTPEDPELLAGAKIYHDECSMCHNEGEEGAPALTNIKQWEARENKGLPTLLDHAINGFTGSDGEMPARGGTKTLTDEQVTAAVKFMIATYKK